MTDQQPGQMPENDAFEAALAAASVEDAAPTAVDVVDPELAIAQDESGDVVEDEIGRAHV